jgi:hypothetical protein
MKRTILLTASLWVFTTSLVAQGTSTAADQEAAYTRTITARAEKIVAALAISDSAKSTRLVKIIADQYRNLNNIHTSRDELVQALKKSGGEQNEVAANIKTAEDDANARLEKLHKFYLSQLSAELTAAQVDQVKDGMTYGVVPITYKGYNEMIPRLTEDQKKQIMEWLVEAREHAMDAGSSEKKHWWFGKYKGRINNYLSAQGYDLKKEGEAWEKRRNEAKSGSNN